MSSYANSEAGKSDIATVCSGSVAEDIEISSLDMTISNASINVVSSPTSERNLSITGPILRRSVEFDPSSFRQLQRQAVSYSHPQSLISDIASASPPPPNHHADQSSATTWNDMGPPLSRALLMQSLQTNPGTTGSRAGSVKSYGSNAGASQNSDLVAHVDTDDCGGSLMESVTDGHSVHSQEDVRSQTEEVEAPFDCPGPASTELDRSELLECNAGNEDTTHPFLKTGDSRDHANGRTSPGGTIYKGKGVRRYQGRYMNLPLQRFRQDFADDDDLLGTVLEADKVMNAQNLQQRNGRGYGGDDYWRRSQALPIIVRNVPKEDRYERVRGRSPARINGFHGSSGANRRGPHGFHHHSYQNHHHHRSRSRSFSPDARRSSRRKWQSRGGSGSPREAHRSGVSYSSRRHYHHHVGGRQHHGGSPSPPQSPRSPSETSRRVRKRPLSQSRGRS